MVGATVLRENGSLEVLSPRDSAAVSKPVSAANQVAEAILDVAALRGSKASADDGQADGAR